MNRDALMRTRLVSWFECIAMATAVAFQIAALLALLREHAMY